MNIEKNLRELNAKDTSVLSDIGKLRVAAWSQNISVGNVPGNEWIDAFDSDSTHFGIYDAERLIAAARFSVHESVEDVPEPEVYRGVFQSSLKAPIASLNRLVAHPDYRGLGCSFYLDKVRLQKARQMGCTSMCSDGRWPYSIRERCATEELAEITEKDKDQSGFWR